MDEIVDEYSPDQEIHVVLDNYCTHKKNEEWLARNKNVHFHFTPTSASWLNQVEIWFGIFSRKALRGASFTSPQKLRQRIEDFIERYNPYSKPFKWHKREVRGSLLKDNTDNLIIWTLAVGWDLPEKAKGIKSPLDCTSHKPYKDKVRS